MPCWLSLRLICYPVATSTCLGWHLLYNTAGDVVGVKLVEVPFTYLSSAEREEQVRKVK
jgi:hypothetical protein